MEAGRPLFTLYSEEEALIEEPYRMLEATVKIGEKKPERQPLIREVVAG